MKTRSFHDLSPEAFNFVWDNSIEPAMVVQSGDTVLFHARDASDGQIERGSDPDDVAQLDFSRVNPVSGPVLVDGARPGDVLEIEILELIPGSWGWTAIIPGFGLLADEYPEPWLRISEIDAESRTIRFSDRVVLPLRPFPGTIGVAPTEAGAHSVIPPTRWGGNLDTRHLIPGSTLLLPVGVEGALLSVGDTHAAQGDGEVCGTAVESAMDVAVRVTVRHGESIEAPQLRTKELSPASERGYHVCTGVGPDITEAARDAVRNLVSFLADQHGLGAQESYALASVACDLRIHELVDVPNWVVGACLPLDVFV